MLSALKGFFTSPATWLVILQYFGFVLAAGSSIWGTLSEFTVKTHGGRRHLTAAGKGAVGLTILGLLVSIVSVDLQRRQAAADAKAEAARTNAIIIAGQPLTSLDVRWSISGITSTLAQVLAKGDADAESFIEDQQGERDYQQNQAVYRSHDLYPFLIELAREFANDSSKAVNANVVVLLALDDDEETVLPFGDLRDNSVWPKNEKQASPLPRSSVEVEDHGDYGDFGNAELRSWPQLSHKDSRVTISWSLDPATFAKAIDRQIATVEPTAKLPDVFRIAVLFDLKGLPFAPANFALPENPNFWKYPDYQDTENENFRGKLALISNNFSSTLDLVPNSSGLIAYHYNLKRAYETLFLDSYGEASNDLRCVVFEFQKAPEQHL
jgi:hypothetical protein